jgi:hypothetical protein
MFFKNLNFKKLTFFKPNFLFNLFKIVHFLVFPFVTQFSQHFKNCDILLRDGKTVPVNRYEQINRSKLIIPTLHDNPPPQKRKSEWNLFYKILRVKII